MRLVLATVNPGKVLEISSILPLRFVLNTLSEVGVTSPLPETSGTIYGNACQKALTVWELVNCDCIADDSGLEVDALGGKPGVDSAYFAGHPRDDDRNTRYLLDQLEGVENRKAAFVTVIALVLKGELFTFEGRLEGSISHQCKGSHGFGYDPVFIPSGYDRTLAELGSDIKNSISHRASALAKLVAFLDGREELV